MGIKWTEPEDELLRQLVHTYGKQWSVIAAHIPTRTAAQVTSRWEKCINPLLTKGAFTSDEDAIIIDFVSAHGTHSWTAIAQILPHRSPKQCRERWLNQLDPAVLKKPWTPEEDNRVFELYRRHGPKWTVIAPLIEGRTDNAIKNRWNASICHRIRTDANGIPRLAPAKERTYTPRREKQVHKPPPLAIPSTADSTDQSEGTRGVLDVTAVTFGFGAPRFGDEWHDPTDMLDGFSESPLAETSDFF
jgi:hypothetical protein